MTTAARVVLEDCRGALAELVDGLQGGAWRRRWVTALVLLRSVGYVLNDVDGKRSRQWRQAIDDAWASPERKTSNLFAFIDDERNNIVHEYKISAGHGATVHELGAPCQWVEQHYVINSGPFAGRDQRDVVREAIAWWEAHIDAIDKAVAGP